MNIFDLKEKDMKEFLEKKLSKISSEDLLNELIECGLELKGVEFNTFEITLS